jgi:hypothetical protein
VELVVHDLRAWRCDRFWCVEEIAHSSLSSILFVVPFLILGFESGVLLRGTIEGGQFRCERFLSLSSVIMSIVALSADCVAVGLGAGNIVVVNLPRLAVLWSDCPLGSPLHTGQRSKKVSLVVSACLSVSTAESAAIATSIAQSSTIEQPLVGVSSAKSSVRLSAKKQKDIPRHVRSNEWLRGQLTTLCDGYSFTSSTIIGPAGAPPRLTPSGVQVVVGFDPFAECCEVGREPVSAGECKVSTFDARKSHKQRLLEELQSANKELAMQHEQQKKSSRILTVVRDARSRRCEVRSPQLGPSERERPLGVHSEGILLPIHLQTCREVIPQQGAESCDRNRFGARRYNPLLPRWLQ